MKRKIINDDVIHYLATTYNRTLWPAYVVVNNGTTVGIYVGHHANQEVSLYLMVDHLPTGKPTREIFTQNLNKAYLEINDDIINTIDNWLNEGGISAEILTSHLRNVFVRQLMVNSGTPSDTTYYIDHFNPDNYKVSLD